MKKSPYSRGFISILLIAIIALIALKYFLDWSVFDAAESEQGQETISYTSRVLHTIWDYISYPVTWAWDNIIRPVLSFAWDAFQLLFREGREAMEDAR